LTNFLLETGIL